MSRNAVELSSKTLVVLDKDAQPLTRLWCLYEIAVTTRGNAHLLMNGETGDLKRAIDKVDVATAQCGSKADNDMIRKYINDTYGSEGALTSQLRSDLSAVRTGLLEKQFDSLQKMIEPSGDDGESTAVADPNYTPGMRWRKAQALRVARSNPRWGSESAVSVSFLLDFKKMYLTGKSYKVPRDWYDKHSVCDDVDGENLTTKAVVELIIKRECKQSKCRFAELLEPKDVWAEGKGPFTFISHAFSNKFMLVLDSLPEEYTLEKAKKETFIWLDIFASAS